MGLMIYEYGVLGVGMDVCIFWFALVCFSLSEEKYPIEWMDGWL